MPKRDLTTIFSWGQLELVQAVAADDVADDVAVMKVAVWMVLLEP